MYELCSAASSAYYIDCPSKIGLVTEGKTVYAIDSGSDKDTAKKVLKTILAQGWELAAIFNTHSHADHIGGNAYLQEQTGCKIYANGMERCFTEFPLLEPTFLYGGFPPESLRYKFLLARQSRPEALSAESLPACLTSLPLPGHCGDMVGFRTDEGIVYLADCLAAEETLEKYGTVFLWDVAAYLQTLEQVKTMDGALFIPSHAAPTENIAPLAQFNIDATLRTAEQIVGCCAEPCQFEAILKQLFDFYGNCMNPTQYVLVGSTLRSYLTWLQNIGKVDCVFEENRMLWVAKPEKL